jgi:hypothetical protein
MTKYLRTARLVIFGVCLSSANGSPPAKDGADSGEAKMDPPIASISRLGFSFETPSRKIENLHPSIFAYDPIGPILVLPTMRVAAKRVDLSKTEVLSNEGRVQFAVRKYTTPLYRVTFGPLSQIATYYFNFLTILNGWHPNEAEAMTLYLEDDRIRILSEADNLIWLESIDRKKELPELKQMHFQIRSTGINALYWNPFH